MSTVQSPFTWLFSKLPAPGQSFPYSDRRRWFDALRLMLDMEYGPEVEPEDVWGPLRLTTPVYAGPPAEHHSHTSHASHTSHTSPALVSDPVATDPDPVPQLNVVQGGFQKRRGRPPKRPTFMPRVCAICNRQLLDNAFANRYSKVCLTCEEKNAPPPPENIEPPSVTLRVRRGEPCESVPKPAPACRPHAARLPDATPGSLSADGRYTMTKDEYFAHKRGDTETLYARLRPILRQSRVAHIQLLSPTGVAVERVNAEEILEP